MTASAFVRRYDFSQPLDDLWEAIPEKNWTFTLSPGCARLANTGTDGAEIFLRPCCSYGDSIEFQFVDGAPRRGTFRFGFLAGFEYITFTLDLTSGKLAVTTQEFHKAQPRHSATIPTNFRSLRVVHETDHLPRLPFSGSQVTLLADDRPVAIVREIDFLPESLFMFGLSGPGEISLSSLMISGPARSRPEYVCVGVWQQSIKPQTADNVESLIAGVRLAAAAGVQILVTPETSLTGLRCTGAEVMDRSHIQSELRRFQDAVHGIANAPHTLVGYPEWVDGKEFEGATAPTVRVNEHRFVAPDGHLGPRMMKVHSCEEGLWHGRRYNLQRVAGVEVAVGVCHDGHYQDVWSVGVMAGARLCLHPTAGGKPRGGIPSVVQGYRRLGNDLDAFWAYANAGGGAAVVYPNANRKQPDTILAVTADLTEANPTYPEYSSMGDLLAHARIRLWDATGCYPLRTLRAGSAAYRAWSSLMPSIVDV